MVGFRTWLESLKVNDYLGGMRNAAKVESWLTAQPQVRELLAKIDQANLVRPEAGKSGYLVMSKAGHDPFTGQSYFDSHTGNAYQHRIPVRFLRAEKGEAELERTDGQDFSEIAYKAPSFPDPRTKRTIVVPLNRITVVKNDQFQTYLKWLTASVSRGAQAAGLPIPKYFRQYWDKIKFGLEGSVTNPQMQSQFRTTNLGFDHFSKVLPEPKAYRGGRGGQARVIEAFPNGFKWVSLDREACQEEGDAGGHCGNTGDPRPGDNVLSLRDKDNRVYLTFVINNGELSERKANGNRKPPKELHPYILQLLKNQMVKSIGPGKYLSENDFQLEDLDQHHLDDLAQARPDLINVSKADLLFMKHRDKPRKVIDRLRQAYPGLQKVEITGYDPADRALVIGHGEAINHGYKPQWSQALGVLSYPTHGLDEVQVVMDYWHDLPPATQAAVYDYFKANVKKLTAGVPDPDQVAAGKYDRGTLHETILAFWREDKTFRRFVEIVLHDAYTRSAISYVNEKLKQSENGQGIYYKVKLTNGGYYYAYLMLPTAEARRLAKAEPDLNVTPSVPGHQADIRMDHFTEAVQANLKRLIYTEE